MNRREFPTPDRKRTLIPDLDRKFAVKNIGKVSTLINKNTQIGIANTDATSRANIHPITERSAHRTVTYLSKASFTKDIRPRLIIIRGMMKDLEI
jgi:hypothetical protein